MFDVGFSELVLIALVALLVFGPERLPSLVRETTLWIRKIRGLVTDAKTEIDRELQLMERRETMEAKKRRFQAEAENMILPPSDSSHGKPDPSPSVVESKALDSEHKDDHDGS